MTMSMTGFARAEIFNQETAISVEMRSYNSRNLDLSLRLPKELAEIEIWAKKAISQKVVRGRVDVFVHVEETRSEDDLFEIDEAKATALYNTYSRLKESLGLGGEITLDLILKNGDVIKPAESQKDMEIFIQDAKKCLIQALDDLVAMRNVEGKHMEEDFLNRLDYIENGVEEIGRASAGMTAYYKERLIKRISELTAGTTPPDPERIDQETAFIADKSDISEEITRVASHIKQFRDILSVEAAPGRKLNFLVQELNREFNTIGSKTGSVEASRIVLDMKSELEKIREQAQNVE